MTRARPVSSSPRSARNSRLSSGSASCAISASIAAEITTASAPSALAQLGDLRRIAVAGRRRRSRRRCRRRAPAWRSGAGAGGNAACSSVATVDARARACPRAARPAPARSAAISAFASLSPPCALLASGVGAPLQAVEIGEHQLGLDRLDVADRIDRALDMGAPSPSKQRTTWTMASTSRIWPRNWLPSPSPLLAPRTRPGDVDEFELGRHDLAPTWRCVASVSSRSSGTATRPTFGSMVQKG